MHSVREIIGKPIVSTKSGDKLGSVSDALFEEEQMRLVALVIGGGILGGERVLPFRDLQTLGGDTVLARTHDGVQDAKEWHDAGVKAVRSSSLRGRAVLTDTGRRLGEVRDLLVDDHTGAFAALEVETSAMGGLRHKRSTVSPADGIRFGPDAVVVPEAATTREEPEAEPSGPDQLGDAPHR